MREAERRLMPMNDVDVQETRCDRFGRVIVFLITSLSLFGIFVLTWTPVCLDKRFIATEGKIITAQRIGLFECRLSYEYMVTRDSYSGSADVDEVYCPATEGDIVQVWYSESHPSVSVLQPPLLGVCSCIRDIYYLAFIVVLGIICSDI
jgi:hypothetical protein